MIVFAIAFYIVGLIVFSVFGLLQSEWYNYYYLWDKCKDLLLFTGIYLIIPKPYKFGLICVVIFSTIRFLWQIICTFTGADINNTEIAGWLFIILALAVLLAMINDLKKWRK